MSRMPLSHMKRAALIAVSAVLVSACVPLPPIAADPAAPRAVPAQMGPAPGP